MNPLEDAADWCTGRAWHWRAVLLGALVGLGWRELGDPDAWSIWSGLTLVAHEAGHAAFSWFGELLMVAGGSFMQLLVPIIAGVVLARQRDWFGIAVSGLWLASSLAGLSRYIGDARAQDLPLVGLGPDPEHDWYYLLDRFDRHIAAVAAAEQLFSSRRETKLPCELPELLGEVLTR